MLRSFCPGRRSPAAAALLLACTALAPGAVLYVGPAAAGPSESALAGATVVRSGAIQAAIDAAEPGDVVWIADGTYYETNIDFRGKAIHVRSVNGPNNCTVNAAGRGFHFHSGEDPDSVLEGFTIRWGRPAIHCDGSSPRIVGCVLRDSSVEGGLATDTLGLTFLCENGSSPQIENTTFRQNEARAGLVFVRLFGAALGCRGGSSPVVTGCVFLSNSVLTTWSQGGEAGGGAVACLDGSQPAFSNCRFESNMASCYATAIGGAVYCDSTSPTFANCQFVSNSAQTYGSQPGTVGGGAVACMGASRPRFVGCEFRGNGAPAQAGAVYSFASSPVFEDCTFAQNVVGDIAAGTGVGVFLAGGGAPRLENCTFSEHTGRWGAAIYCHGTDPLIADCTIWGNTATFGAVCAEWRACPHITRTVFQANSAAGFYGRAFADGLIENCFFANNTGPAVQLIYFCNPLIRNCTLAGNDQGIVSIHSCAPQLVQSIIFGNTGRELTLLPIAYMPAALGADWSCIDTAAEEIFIGPDCTLTWGDGNISAPPLLAPADYHLQPGSPCSDAGDPSFAAPGERDLDGQARIWNGRVDIGADEFQSYFPGDLNCDEAVNQSDIPAFVLALVNPAEYASAYPGCSPALADMNGDGAVNALDINPFVRALPGLASAGDTPDGDERGITGVRLVLPGPSTLEGRSGASALPALPEPALQDFDPAAAVAQ